MKQREKLAALMRLATLRRETALQHFAIAKAGEMAVRARLGTLADQRAAAILMIDPADTVARAQLDCYLVWADAQRKTAQTALAEAVQTTDEARKDALLAVGRIQVIEKIDRTLATQARARRV